MWHLLANTRSHAGQDLTGSTGSAKPGVAWESSTGEMLRQRDSA